MDTDAWSSPSSCFGLAIHGWLFRDYLANDSLKLNNAIKVCLISLINHFIILFFIKHLSSFSIALWSTEKS